MLKHVSTDQLMDLNSNFWESRSEDVSWAGRFSPFLAGVCLLLCSWVNPISDKQ